jgi:hypothetical protein
MAWTSVTEQRVHGILGATSIAAVLEMAGGAPNDERSVLIAAICFGISIPVNVYAWIMLDNDMGGGSDTTHVFETSGLNQFLDLAAALSTTIGIASLLFHFSWLASAAFLVTTAALLVYHLRTGLPYVRALQICREHTTRDARLKAWNACTHKDEAEFDRITGLLRTVGRLPE